MDVKDGDIFRKNAILFIVHITDHDTAGRRHGYAYTWAPLTSEYGALGSTSNTKRNINQFTDGYEYVGNIREFGDAFIAHLLKRDL